MPDTIPSVPAAAAAPASNLINRRVTIRRPCPPALSTGMARKSSYFKQVLVQDVSEGGLALLLRQPPQVGEQIYLQLTNRILNFTYDLVAEVRHVHRVKGRNWIVGVQFEQPLSPEELAALL